MCEALTDVTCRIDIAKIVAINFFYDLSYVHLRARFMNVVNMLAKKVI